MYSQGSQKCWARERDTKWYLYKYLTDRNQISPENGEQVRVH